jgi:AraC-like DNA-binding protein
VSPPSKLPGRTARSIERFGQLDQSYRERLPAPQISSQVASVWMLEVAADALPYEHRTVPNGSVEISYVLGSNRVDVAGPQRRPTVGRLPAGSTIVGMRFRPGAAPSLLGPPAYELVDLQVEVDRLWERGAATLVERLAEAPSADAAARLLELEVIRRAAAAREPDPLVTAAVRRFQPWLSRTVAESTAELFISPRQLRRRFTAALGFGPKMLQRILRFQGFLALTQGAHDHDVSLVRLARAAGYSDQAHLTRECSELTGLTPKAFLEEMWRSCGPNHDHDVSYAGLRRALLAARRG